MNTTNMRTLALALVTMLVPPLILPAQEARLLITGGAGLSNLLPGPHALFHEYRPAFLFGVGYARPIKRTFEARVQLMMERRGGGSTMVWTDITGQPYGEGTYSLYFDHISLPISVAFRTAGKMKAQGAIGVVPSHLFQAREILPAIPGFSDDRVINDVTSNTIRWTIGLSGEAGVSRMLGDRYGLYLGGRYFHGLAQFGQGNLYFRDSMFALLLGLEISLGTTIRSAQPDQ